MPEHVFAYDCGNLSEGDARTMLLDMCSVLTAWFNLLCVL